MGLLLGRHGSTAAPPAGYEIIRSRKKQNWLITAQCHACFVDAV
jgi:hypothetical protein